jgi:hypothetical protein
VRAERAEALGVAGFNYCTAEAMGAALPLGGETIGLADIAGAVLVGAGVAAGAGARRPDNGGERNGGGAAAQPDADGGTACLAHIARTGAPRGATPPHSVTIQACSNMYKS